MELCQFGLLFSHNFFDFPDVALVSIEKYVNFVLIFPNVSHLLICLSQGLAGYVGVPSGCDMKFLNNVFFLHQTLYLIVEIAVASVPMAFQHLYSEHVKLYQLG